jgi:hypothetical protein
LQLAAEPLAEIAGRETGGLIARVLDEPYAATTAPVVRIVVSDCSREADVV